MNFLNPIYTEKRECQDCYKCVRHCPVKAIKVEGGYASVVPELCILCGHCVEVCPNSAKRVRDDLPHARQLLALKPRVVVSLAPSYVSEFPELTPGQLIRAFKRLGFFGVSETALGAQQVSAQAAAALAEGGGRVLYSSACPTVVSYLQKHRPADSQFLTGLLSPLLTHCKMLRQTFRAGHRHRVRRAVHRQEARSRATPGVARRGAHLRRFAPLAGPGEDRAGNAGARGRG